MSRRQELEIGRRLGPYVIIRQIGRGGMGEVYEAYEDRLHRRVALKVVSTSEDLGDRDDIVRRFIVEARALAKIYHPNIVTVHAIDNLDNVRFIAMEYVEGTSLRRVLDHFMWTAYDVSSMFLQALEALRCLHENGILHRDIKPQNLMLRPDGQIKILDLGIAKVVGNEIQNTAPGAFVGTVNYMAPEVAGGADATAQSDIWSLGAIYYETLVGKRLAPNSDKGNLLSALDTVSKIECKFTGEAANRVPKSVQEFVMKLCARDPKDRYKSASEAIEDLKKRAMGRTALDPSLCSSVISEIERIDKERALGREVRIEHMLLKGYPKVGGRYVIGSELPVDPLPIMAPTLTNVFPSKDGSPQFLPSEEPPLDSSEMWSPDRSKKEKRLMAVGMTLGAIAFAIMVFVIIAVGSHHPSEKGSGRSARTESSSNVNKANFRHNESLKLESPVNLEAVWLNPTDAPTFSWSDEVRGAYLIEVSTSANFARPMVSEPISGKNYRLSRSLPEGEFHWRLIDKNHAQLAFGPNRFYVLHSTAPEPLLPGPNATFSSGDSSGAEIQIEWKCKPGQRTYHLQVVTVPETDSPVIDTILSACALPGRVFAPGKYAWRVRAEGSSIAEWSRAQKFRIEPRAGSAQMSTAQTESKRSLSNRKPVAQSKPQELPTRAESPVASPIQLSRTVADPSVPAPRQEAIRVSLVFDGSVSGREPAAVIRRQLQNPPQLNWSVVNGAKGYLVQIATDSDFRQTLHEETVTSTSYVWRNVRPGRFHWRVCAISRPGSCNKFGPTGRVELLVPAPNLRSTFKLSKRGGLSTVDMSWNPVPLSERYIVQASPDRRFASTSSELITSKPSASLSLRDSTAKYVRVAVLGPDNSPSSAFSAPASISTTSALQAPTLVSPLPGARFMSKDGNAKTIVVFTWDEVASASEYLIEVAQDARFTKILKRQSSKTNRLILREALEPGELFWRVRARSQSDLSDWGGSSSFVIQGTE